MFPPKQNSYSGRSIVQVALLSGVGVVLVAAALVGCGQTSPPAETMDDDGDQSAPSGPDGGRDPKEGPPRTREPKWWVAYAEFSADGKRLLTLYNFDGHPRDRGQFPNALTVWEVATGKELWSIKAADLDVSACAFLPGNKGVLVKCQHRLKVLDMTNGKVVRALVKDERPMIALAVSPDGRYALSADGHVKDVDETGLTLWDIRGGKEIRKRETGMISHVVFSRDGRLGLAGAGCGGHLVGNALEPWDIPQRKLLLTLPCSDGWMPHIAFSSDGKLALANRQNVHPDQGDGAGIAGLVLWEVQPRRLCG
jgi:WD40 repeat protein